jgi:hypothetical protein
MKPLATIPCDNCGDQTAHPEQCLHGWELCPNCCVVDCCQGCTYKRGEVAAVRMEETRSAL